MISNEKLAHKNEGLTNAKCDLRQILNVKV